MVTSRARPILSKYRTAIFVNGCFWHGHNCKSGRLPETKREFWEKINETKKRDKIKKEELEIKCWKVITVWSCEIDTIEKKRTRLKILLDEILYGEKI